MSDVDALLSQKNDQAARRESGSEVVASRDAVGEEQDGVVFEGAGVTQPVMFVDVLLDFTREPWTEKMSEVSTADSIRLVFVLRTAK